MTGTELAQTAKTFRSDIPVILCSGFSELINKKKTDALGINKFLTKPVTMHELAEAIREVLDSSKALYS